MKPPYAAAVLALALTACASDTSPGAAPSQSTAPTATTVTTAPSTPGATPTAKPQPTKPSATALPTDLQDGARHYARLTTIDTTKRTLTVDVVQFLTGEAAEKAAQEDGEEAFDYYVRNQNTKLRTLTFTPGLEVVVNALAAGESGSSSKDTPVTVAKLASYLAKGEAQQRVFWFTLKGGAMVTLHEQYLP